MMPPRAEMWHLGSRDGWQPDPSVSAKRANGINVRAAAGREVARERGHENDGGKEAEYKRVRPWLCTSSLAEVVQGDSIEGSWLVVETRSAPRAVSGTLENRPSSVSPHSNASCSSRVTGSGRNSIVSATVMTAVAEPMPSARVATAVKGRPLNLRTFDYPR